MTDPRVASLQQAVPDQRLKTDAADLEHYGRDWTRRWTPAPLAIALPATVEEVQAIVRLANEHKTPLWPVARGKNLGYGTAAPRMAGSVVLDLGRMNKILELDPTLAYCVVEPGVGYFDLYEAIQRDKLPLWLSVPGNAWGSVMGNTLEHGIGYTPYGLHARNLCGIEAVLETARAEVLAAGFREIEYLELRDAASLAPVTDLAKPMRMLAAAWLGDVRLIDNIDV